jgi:hypothetical protein
MTKTSEYELGTDRRAALLREVFARLSPGALTDPNLPDVLNRMVDERLGASVRAGAGPQHTSARIGGTGANAPADGGFLGLIGFGGDIPTELGQLDITPGVQDYDDDLKSERILGAADLYYLYMHDRIGIFEVVFKLQELFRAGTLRISSGPGALGLYRFDKRAVLRYRQVERLRAYRRVFGYTNADPGPNARSNPEFHPLFVHFIGETAKFWRDKRISEVIRDNATDPTFGSIAIVRRAGLDLRNNLKNSSYGFVNVLRIEALQALKDAFNILEAHDIREQFGAESAWDVIELVMWQYFHRSVSASTMNRMAVAGRAIIQWLAEPYVLETDRRRFEAQLYPIAESAEEWISSEEGLRLTRPTPPPRNVFNPGPPPSVRGGRPAPVAARRAARPVGPRQRPVRI